jgi:hypothetical protein
MVPNARIDRHCGYHLPRVALVEPDGSDFADLHAVEQDLGPLGQPADRTAEDDMIARARARDRSGADPMHKANNPRHHE